MDSRPLIQESLQILSLICVDPFSCKFIHHFYRRCSAVIVFGVFIDVLLYLCFNYQGIESTMEILITLGYSHIAIKMVFFLAYRKELAPLIENINMFWEPNLNALEQQKENKKIFSTVQFCVRSYIALLLIICLLYFIKPLFIAQVVDLPWRSCWSKFFSYKVCYVLELIQLPVLVLTEMGFDIFYVALITNIICEFKLLETRFPNLMCNPEVMGTDKEVMGTDKEGMDELGKLIDHHNLILECISIMKYVYRTPMLGLFLSNMCGMGFAMIILTYSTSNAIKLLFGMLTIFYLVQLSFYSILGSMLSDESIEISNYAYDAKWWIKTQPELRRALVAVMRRANKPEILIAGGLLEVNLETLRMIIKNTFSFFTFMQVIFNKS